MLLWSVKLECNIEYHLHVCGTISCGVTLHVHSLQCEATCATCPVWSVYAGEIVNAASFMGRCTWILVLFGNFAEYLCRHDCSSDIPRIMAGAKSRTKHLSTPS